MPSSTTNYALPYPLPADAVNPPSDIQALATAVDNALLTQTAVHLCFLQHQGGQGLTSATDAILTFGAGSETIKTDAAWHSTSTNVTRISPTLPGKYRVVVKGTIAFNILVAAANVYVAKNGAVYDRTGNIKHYNKVGAGTDPLTSNTAASAGELTTYVTMNGTTDYLEMGMVQISNTAAGQTTNGAASGLCSFAVEYMGA